MKFLSILLTILLGAVNIAMAQIKIDVSDAVFSIVKPLDGSITVSAPDGGENWLLGSTHDITWTYSDVQNIKIEYSTDNGSVWMEIEASVPASGQSYSWTISGDTSSQCLVKLTDADDASVFDQSNAVFIISSSIEVPDAPALISPADNAEDIDISVDLLWYKADRADHYHVQASYMDDFSTLINGGQDIADTTLPLQDLIKDTIIYWRVAAGNTSGYGTWSEVWSFRTVPVEGTVDISLPIAEEDPSEYEHKKFYLAVTFDDVNFEEGYEPDAVELIVKFKKTFLYPEITYTDDGDWRTVSISPEISALTDGYSYDIPCLLTLGDTISTDILIDTIIWSGKHNDISANVTKGSLTLINLGIDSEGRLRMLKVVDPVIIINNTWPNPINPVDNNLGLSVNVSAKTNASIELYDSGSTLVYSIEQNLKKGDNDIELSLPKNLSSGSYNLIIRTGQSSASVNIVIIK